MASTVLPDPLLSADTSKVRVTMRATALNWPGSRSGVPPDMDLASFTASARMSHLMMVGKNHVTMMMGPSEPKMYVTA